VQNNTQQTQQKNIHAPAEFEPTVPGIERPQNDAFAHSPLDRQGTIFSCKTSLLP